MSTRSSFDHGHDVNVNGCPDCHERRRRRRVCHGWAFREHPTAEVAAVRAYLAGADPAELVDLPTTYRRLHARLT